MGVLVAGICIENFGPKVTIIFSTLMMIPAVIIYYKIKD